MFNSNNNNTRKPHFHSQGTLACDLASCVGGVSVCLSATLQNKNGVDRGFQLTFNGEGAMTFSKTIFPKLRYSIGLLTFYTAILLIGSQNRRPFVSVLLRNIQ